MVNSIVTQTDANRLADFFNNILAWGSYIDLIEEGCIDKQIGKIKEEVAEYQAEIEECNYDEAAEELVDVLVTVLISAEQNNICIVDHLQKVVDKLVSRQDTGKIVDGTFRKAEDL